ncbi:MAG: sialidase family protein [Candidatus Latescibacterota bacterium]
MRILENALVVPGEPDTDRAACTFPAALTLASGEVLLTYRTGSTKDSDDETIEMRRSTDGGRSWGAPRRCFDSGLDGVRGSLKVCYLTELAPGRVLAAAMWIDRQAFPGQPLFNAQTEGCLPMAVVLAESQDGGRTWPAWRRVPLPEQIGPPSLTSPLLRLPDGSLAMSIETNKAYHDASQWYQRVVHFHSRDEGRTWGDVTVAGEDPSGRIFNWDQRAAVAPDGRLVTFTWTYDSQTRQYLNVHRRISSDRGGTWTPAEDMHVTDQAGRPAVLPDGRVVLPWVDRFGDQSIKARSAAAIDAPFAPHSEVTLYCLQETQKHSTATTGDLLAEMGLWTFGLPFALVLPDGDVLVLFYAGDSAQMGIHAARLRA